MRTLKTTLARNVRHRRLRKKVAGSAAKPRLAVFRSNRHVYAQLIDDTAGRTLVAASTVDKEAGVTESMTKSQAAKQVGALLGRRARESAVTAVVFDRGGYKYHGRVREVAEGAREAGLTF